MKPRDCPVSQVISPRLVELWAGPRLVSLLIEFN